MNKYPILVSSIAVLLMISYYGIVWKSNKINPQRAQLRIAKRLSTCPPVSAVSQFALDQYEHYRQLVSLGLQASNFFNNTLKNDPGNYTWTVSTVIDHSNCFVIVLSEYLPDNHHQLHLIKPR